METHAQPTASPLPICAAHACARMRTRTTGGIPVHHCCHSELLNLTGWLPHRLRTQAVAQWLPRLWFCKEQDTGTGTGLILIIYQHKSKPKLADNVEA